MRPEDHPDGYKPIWDARTVEAAQDHYGKDEVTDEEIEDYERNK